MLRRLADLVIGHPRRALAVLVAAFVVAAVYGGPATGVLGARNDFEDPGSQSAHGRSVIERATGAEATPGVLVLVRAPAASAPTLRAERTLSADPDVAAIGAPQPSADASSTLVPARLRASVEPHHAVDRLTHAFAGQRLVSLGGRVVAGRQVGQQASADLGLAEALAFPLLALLALLVFRGPAAALPLGVGGVSVLSSFAVLRLINGVFALSTFALNLVIGLGLGLAVDYTLLMVSRFREERGAGREVPDAVRATMMSAGRTVAFSAVTVAVAMSSLLVFPLRFLQSMGLGGAVVALLAAAVALTALPAAFAVFGGRLGTAKPAAQAESGRWYRLAHAVLRRPVPVALATGAAMIALAVPALHMRWSGVDASVLPTSRSARVVQDEQTRRFPSSRPDLAFVAVQAGPGAGARVEAYAARAATVGGIRLAVAPRYVGAGTWEVQLALPGRAIDTRAQHAIAQLRALPASLPVSVGGEGAQFADQRAAISRGLPAALAILVLGTLLALWLMTGSAVLPVKALAMNALTVGSATGLLVLVFQDGRFTGPLGYTSQGGIEQSDYLVLAAIAFALSTDYGVFLLTRIKEAFDAGRDSDEAVAVGVQGTGRIVTAAAVLLAVALGAFATSQVVFLKEIGLGAVAAVLLDAFLVRALLVPALMGLLGRWNWWAPAPLRRLHARIAFQPA